MAINTIYKYFAYVRFSKTDSEYCSFHIDACSELGAIYQTTLLLKKHKIKKVYSITIKENSYPIEIRKRKKFIKETIKKKNLSKSFKIERNNIKAIESMKARLDAIEKPKGDSL